MPDLAFNYFANHTRIEVNSELLSAGRLATCLLQLPPTVQEAHTDERRPLALNALRDLLAGGNGHAQPALNAMMPGAGPVLVVSPEYAFGSGDWNDVDALVRAAGRPLVLVAGFGATAGSEVLSWSTVPPNGGTERHLSWQQDTTPISPVRRVNGGWCWIHEPGGTTHCICYLKSVLEQGYEAVELDDLQTGTTLLHLRFADLDLTPLICADLLQPAAHNQFSPQARIQAALAQVAVDRPALVVGSLLQLGFNVNWSIAIDSLLNTALAGRKAAVVLCNVSHDVPATQEETDKWRCLSGVFVRFGEHTKGQKSLPAARALNAQGVVGAVVRYTHAAATVGEIAWPPYNPINGDLIWRGNMYCAINDQGLVAPIAAAPRKEECEVLRFLRRYPPDQGTAPRLTSGINALRKNLLAGEKPSPAALINATLNGVTVAKQIDADHLGQDNVASALKLGLHAVAALKSIDGFAWQEKAESFSQLQAVNMDIDILVWRSATDTRRAMQRSLSQWRLSGANQPSLVVLGTSAYGDLQDEEIVDELRDDISLAPAPIADLQVGGSLGVIEGDYTTSRARGRVATLSLGHVADLYLDYDQSEDHGRATALFNRITACFQGNPV